MLDIVKIRASMEKVKRLSQPVRKKQKSVNVSDIWHRWDLLVMKYDTREVILALLNFVHDTDLQSVLHSTLKHIEKGISEIEQMMVEYAVPLPPRPPETGNVSNNLEIITDDYIFNTILDLIKEMMPVLTTGFNNSTSPTARMFFKDHITGQMVLIDNLMTYGELKGYLIPLARYAP